MLLREREETGLLARIWLLRRARGGAGGTFLGDMSGSEKDCVGGIGLVGDFKSSGVGRGSSEDARGGGGGRGLLRSVGVRGSVGFVCDGLEVVMGRLCVLGDVKLGEKSSKATVCGPLGATTLPCLCLGAGGGSLRFSGLLPSAIKVDPSSSSDTESS